MMTEKRRWPAVLRALSAVFWLAACGSERAESITQVIVALNADLRVAARVVRLEARLYDAEGAPSAPARVERFALRAGESAPDATAVSFPFSFGVTRQVAPSFRLELVGYESWAPDAPPIIERKQLVRFEPRRTVAVSIYLGAACLDRAAACAGLDLTCDPEQAGACVPPGEATLNPTLPGREGFIDMLQGQDAAFDAGWAGDASDLPPGDGGDGDVVEAGAVEEAGPQTAHDAGLVVLPPEVLPACPVENACPMPDYPCVPSDDGEGYTCRGQYAAWPMPDPQPDAKYAPSYTIDAANGVVQDEVTGLLWEREPPDSYPGCSGRLGAHPGDSCTWEEAKHYCSQLTLAGKRWRLPTKIELESLLDNTRPLGEASIDPVAFPHTPMLEYWSASPFLIFTCTDCAHFVSFSGGNVHVAAKSEARRARCVHSARVPNAPPTARYEIDEQAGTVSDSFTGLQWSRGVSMAAIATEQEARAFCANFGPRYRVPTYKELLTLANVTRSENQHDPAFVEIGTAILWSSTEAPYAGNFTYVSALGTALASELSEPSELHVRCVR